MGKQIKKDRQQKRTGPKGSATHATGASRRDFLLATTAGAVAAVMGGCDKEELGFADGGPDDSSSPGGGNDNGPTGPVTAAPDNRVVRVVDSGATTWDGQDPTDFYNYPVADVVDSMVEEGLLALTNESDLESAWRALVPYNDGDLVVIHINAYANSSNRNKNNVCEPISAVIRGLSDVMGIPPEDIAVVDPSRQLLGSPAQERIIDRCLHTDAIQWDRGLRDYGSVITFSQGQAPPAEEQISTVIEDADHLILMPLLSWHSFNWITGSLKMMMGSINDMSSLHSSGGPNDFRDGSGLADICMPFNDKVRLVLTDALFGTIVGNGDPPHAFQTLGGNGGTAPSSALYFSKDMVATDCVMYDDLLDEARAAGSPKSGYAYGYLKFAADENHQLGTFELRDETGSDSYSEIDLVEINRT